MKLGHSTAIALCLLGLSSLCRAQIQLDAQLGFDPQTPLVRANTWVPITVTLRNNGPDKEGVLVIRAGGSKTAPLLRQEYAVLLPKNSVKQIRDVIFIRRNEQVGVDFLVGFKHKSDAGIILSFQLADPTSVSVLIVGDEDWVRSMKSQVRDDPRTLRPVLYAGKIESLSENAHAYDGIDTIILDRVEWTRIFPAQAGALRAFVERGGNLVLSSGRVASGLNNSSIADLVPVSLGPAEGTQQQVRLLPNVVPVRSDRHLLVSRAVAKPETALHIISSDTSGHPIIAESNLGLGRVTFLAFQLGDSVLQDWSGRVYLWRFLFTRRFLPLLDTRADSFTQPMQEVALSNTFLAIPTSNQVGFLLLAYVVGLIPLNQLFWRIVKRPLWAWMTLPVLSLGIGAFVIVNERVVTRGNLSLTEISVLHTQSGRPMATADTFLSLQSPYVARFGVSAKQSALAWLPVASDRDRAFAIQSETSSPELSFDVLRKDVAAFRAIHSAALSQGVEVRAELDEGTIRGQVLNHTGLEFIRSGLMGPTSNDPEFTVIADLPQTNAAPLVLGGSLKSLEETLRKTMLPQINARQRIVFWAVANGAPLDVALREQGGRPTQVSRESRWTLLLCEAPFQLGDGPFEIGPDHWRVRVIRASVYNEREYLDLDAQKLPSPFYYYEVVFEARPDMALTVDSRLEIERLQWELNCNSDAVDLKRELFNYFTNTWEVPANDLSQEQAIQYMHPRTGTVLLRLTGNGQKELGNISIRVVGQRAKPDHGT